MRKKELLTEFNRTNILNSAKKLFVEKGYEQTTMDDICKESDYCKSTIYVYFKNKEEIYNIIICESMKLLKDKFLDCTKDIENTEKCFNSVCETLVNFEENYPLYFSSILGKIGVSEKEFENQPILKQIYETGEEINSIIGRLINSGIERKVFKELNVNSTILILWASISGIISLARQKEDYIKLLGLTKEQIFEDGFKMLYSTLLR